LDDKNSENCRIDKAVDRVKFEGQRNFLNPIIC